MTTLGLAVAGRWRTLQEREFARALVPRFDVHQRAQHLVMLTTFMTLAATGLPQKFGGYEASRWWINVLGGLDMVRTIHRAAGLIMLVDCVYHVSYIAVRLGFQRRFDMIRMIPTIEDAQNMLASFSYALGITRQRPQFDRFSYLEKFDYWAVFWGIAVIGTSGLILLFPVQASGFLSGAALPAARAAHSDEALLAVAWILTVHMFYVFLAPESFPINAAMFTGRMPAHRYRQTHPLEFQRLFSGSRPATPSANLNSAGQLARPRPSPASGRPASRQFTARAARAVPMPRDASPAAKRNGRPKRRTARPSRYRRVTGGAQAL